VLTNQGVIPSTSPAAVLRGGAGLGPENSNNYTLGAYASVGPFDITIDYFDIDVEDRLSLSSDFTLTADDLATLASQGIDASDISQFRFFTDAFSTITSGIDIVLSTETEWLSGVTNWSLAFNTTDTKVTRLNANLLGDSLVRLIEDGVPGTRWNLTGNHDMGQMRLLARVSYFGEYNDDEAGGEFDSATLLDFEAGYDFCANLSGTFRMRNVFDYVIVLPGLVVRTPATSYDCHTPVHSIWF
jgi:Outer membrane receptor for ferrienterochelin and colicins